MTLCGVLKDILLVLASIAIWGTPVSALQFFGYTVALVGMVWFKLGGEKLRVYLGEGGRRWAEFGASHPVRRKMLVFGLVLATLILLLGGLAPAFGYDPRAAAAQGKALLVDTGVLPDGKKSN